MKTSSRRNFLKKVAVTAASAVAVPGLVKAASELGAEGMDDALAASAPGHGGLIVPKGEGLRITGTFLDEISHDIPHQNWGEKEWDADFRHMKSIGIDTVIGIRSGYRKFITYPSPYLLKKGVLHAVGRPARPVPAPGRQVRHEVLLRALRLGRILGHGRHVA